MLLESEARLAAAALGLDPGMGVLHADTPARDSLACDLMEPVRPQVEAFLLDWVMRQPCTGNQGSARAMVRRRRARSRPVPDGDQLPDMAEPFWQRPTGDRGVSEPARACLLDEMESVQDFMALSPEERMVRPQPVGPVSLRFNAGQRPRAVD